MLKSFNRQQSQPTELSEDQEIQLYRQKYYQLLRETLEAAEEQIEKLEDEIERLREQAAQQEATHQERVERLLREASDREGKLQREIGNLEAILNMIRQQQNNDTGTDQR